MGNPREKQAVALGGSFLHRASTPAALIILPIAITPDKVENNTPIKEGVKGMLPACCLPHWGREGVTLLAAAENTRVTQKKRISTKPFF